MSKTHFLAVTYQGRTTRSENNGVGEFNLPERAFSSRTSNHQLRISEVGNFGKRFFNEFRLQFTDETSAATPVSDRVAIIVLDAFSAGGAGNQRRSRRQGVWIANNLLFGLGKIHALKIGGLFEYERRATESEINRNGTFVFSSLEDFALGRPATFTRRPGARSVNLSQIQIGAYIQNDIRLHRSFMLSLGLRYEWQNNLKDSNNFSPRIGFAWSVDKRAKTTFRGGAGVYYNWLETNRLATILSQDIAQPSETIIINPGFPDPFSGGVSRVLPQSYWRLADDLRNPYIFHASIGMQRRLNLSTSLRLLYKYEKGVHQFGSRDINAPLNGARPNPDFGRIVQVESSAFFAKTSLNVGANGKLNSRLSYGVEYTLSKTISDNNGIFGLSNDNYNPRLDRSVSNDDQRHRIYASAFWRVRPGMNFSTVFIANSPLPYTVTTGKDDNGDTVFNDRPLGVRRNSERGAWQKQVNTALSWTVELFRRKDGQTGLPGTIVITPSEAASGDIGISPNHRYSLKFSVTANNVFNQANYTNYVGVQTSPFFRQPIAADNARRVEFGVRFSFLTNRLRFKTLFRVVAARFFC